MKKQIKISSAQKEILKKISQKTTSIVRESERAKLILNLETSPSELSTTRKLKISRTKVRHWKKKWKKNEEIFETIEKSETKTAQKELEKKLKEFLSDAPRTGTPPKFSAENYCQILAIALESPEKSGRTISNWTQEELAEEAIKRKIVESISGRQVGRFLKRCRYKTS